MNIGKLLKISFNWVIYGLSFIAPRDQNIWIFIGWRRSKSREVFADNPKYQFLHVAHNEKRVRPIWIGMDNYICYVLREKGYEAYSLYSIPGVYYSLRAGYTFISALLQPQNWRYTGRSKIIQLWHGKSLKKTGFNSPYGLSRYNRFLLPSIFKMPLKFVAISNYLSDFIVNDFHIPKKCLMITGIPKHDVFFRKIPGSDIDLDLEFQSAISNARAKEPRRLILYAPTFRPNGVNPITQTDLDRLDKALNNLGDQMIITLHPKFSTKDWKVKREFRNITFCQSDYDIYPILPSIDLLITDYSSLGLEFVLMNKPTILYAYDIETFKKSMGVYDELWDLMPEPKVTDFEALLKALALDLNKFSLEKNRALQKLFDFFDGRSAERITKSLLKLNLFQNT